jgi:hypothetical protein
MKEIGKGRILLEQLEDFLAMNLLNHLMMNYYYYYLIDSSLEFVRIFVQLLLISFEDFYNVLRSSFRKFNL